MDIFIRQCEGMNDFEGIAAPLERPEVKYIKNLQGHVIRVTAPRRASGIEPKAESKKTQNENQDAAVKQDKKDQSKDSSTPGPQALFYINYCDSKALYEREH